MLTVYRFVSIFFIIYFYSNHPPSSLHSFYNLPLRQLPVVLMIARTLTHPYTRVFVLNRSLSHFLTPLSHSHDFLSFTRRTQTLSLIRRWNDFFFLLFFIHSHWKPSSIIYYSIVFFCFVCLLLSLNILYPMYLYIFFLFLPYKLSVFNRSRYDVYAARCACGIDGAKGCRVPAHDIRDIKVYSYYLLLIIFFRFFFWFFFYLSRIHRQRRTIVFAQTNKKSFHANAVMFCRASIL